MRLFDQYEVKTTGITTNTELSQVTTNLIVRCLKLPVPVEQIEAKVAAADISSPWGPSEFEAWLYDAFPEFESAAEGAAEGEQGGGADARSSSDASAARKPASSVQWGINVKALKQSDSSPDLQSATQLGNRKDVIRIAAPPTDSSFPDLDAVAFAMVENLCFEADGHLDVGLVRRGRGNGSITVDWETENQSVMDESYEDFKGTVEFADGQFFASIRLPILDNDEWNL